MTSFGQQGITIAVLIALAYMVQIQSAAWYVQVADRIFGFRAKHFSLDRKENIGYKPEPGVVGLNSVVKRV